MQAKTIKNTRLPLFRSRSDLLEAPTCSMFRRPRNEALLNEREDLGKSTVKSIERMECSPATESSK